MYVAYHNNAKMQHIVNTTVLQLCNICCIS